MSDIIIDGETREFNGLEFVYYQGKWFNKSNKYADVGDLIYVEEIYSSSGLLAFSGGEVRAVITTGYGEPSYFDKDINGLTYAFIEHGDRFYPLEEAEINTQHRLNYRFLGKCLSELYEESIELKTSKEGVNMTHKYQDGDFTELDGTQYILRTRKPIRGDRVIVQDDADGDEIGLVIEEDGGRITIDVKGNVFNHHTEFFPVVERKPSSISIPVTGDKVNRPLTVDTSGISYKLPEKALQALSSLYDLAELGVHSADLTVIASEILTAYPLQVSKSGGSKRRVTDFGEVDDD